jgi:hypothetical protein
VSLLFQTLLEVSLSIPLETGALRAACETVIALSRTNNRERLTYIACNTSMQSLLSGLFVSPLGGSLSLDGFAALAETVAVFAHKTHQFHILSQASRSKLSQPHSFIL